MKKILLLTLSLISFTSFAQWQYVGTQGFSSSRAGYQNLAVDGSTTYVAYRDSNELRKCTVMKFDGSNWVNVGTPGFSPDTADYVNIGIMNGTPYVTFKDFGNSKKTSVMKFDGSNWVPVGSFGISQGNSFYPYLAFYNDEVYVVYSDGPTGGSTSVQKFDGSTWSYVGTPGFSTTPGWRPSMTFIDSVPYVSYAEGGSTGFQGSVMKYDYDSTKWVYVGSQGISAGKVIHPMITSDNNNNVFVTYSDATIGNKATVKTFDGTNWVDVGPPGFSADSAGSVDITTDGTNLFCAYTDRSLNDQIVVKLFDGSNWVDVGAPGSVSVQSGYTIDIELNNSIPYVAFRDEFNGFRTSVMKFDSTFNKPALLSQEDNEMVSNVEGLHTWFDCSNDSVLLIDSSTTFQPPYDGSFAVIVSTIGYLDTSACTTFSTINNSIEENKNSQISIYPNPSEGIFNIKSTNSSLVYNKIRVINNISQTVYQSSDNNVTSLNLSNLEKGIYYLELLNNEETLIHKKIIIQE